MPNDNPFLREVINNPDDDDARLVYADYLEDQGDPRGEFIRVQCELARTSQLSASYEDLVLRSDELLEQHEDRWAAELEQDVRKIEFERGFISTVTVLASKLVKQGEDLLQAMPIKWLRLNRVKGFGDRLSQSSALSRIRNLDLSRLKIPTTDLGAILKSPLLNQLSQLNLDFLNAEWNTELADALNQSPSRDRLNQLTMRGDLTQLFVQQLANGPGFPAVEHFSFGSEFGTRFMMGIETLQLPALKSLRIRSRMNTDFSKGLVNFPLSQLQRLDLTNTSIPAAGLKAMANAGAFNELEELRLGGVKFGVRAIEALFQGEQLSKCRVVEIGDYDTMGRRFNNIRFIDAVTAHPMRSVERLSLGYLAEGHISALAVCDNFANLQSLATPGTRLNYSDMCTMGSSPWAASLRALDLSTVEFAANTLESLSSNQIVLDKLLRLDVSGSQVGFLREFLGNGELTSFLSACEMPELQHLDISWNHLTDKSLIALAEMDLPNLRRLDCQGIRFSEKAIRSVLESPRLPRLRQVRLTPFMANVANADYDGRVKFEN